MGIAGLKLLSRAAALKLNLKIRQELNPVEMIKAYYAREEKINYGFNKTGGVEENRRAMPRLREGACI